MSLLVNLGLKEIFVPVIIQKLTGETAEAYCYALLVRELVLRLVTSRQRKHCGQQADVFECVFHITSILGIVR